MLRNGSDADIATNKSTTNYSNEIIGLEIDNNRNLITNPATTPSGGLLWTSRNYNGIYKVQLKWLSEELVRQSEYIYIKPYNFRNIRDWTKECFVKNDKHKCKSILIP